MKAAAYARYSTNLQKETSIASQLKEIADYCDKNDIELVDTFIDEAQTGTNINRAGFSRLLDHAERKDFDAVVVYDISRGSRDVVDWMQFRKKMRELGINVLSVTEKLGDIADPGTFISELITVGIGQHQVLQSRQKSIAGKAILASRGVFCGGIAPLGYDIIDGQYVINEAESQTVRAIFRHYADGKSYSYIIDAVASQRGKRGQKISKTALHSILRNDRYIGVYSWNRYVRRYMHKAAGKKPNPAAVEMDGIIPAIIDQNTWADVQKRIRENTKNKTNKSRTGREYLLSGLIVCGNCGGSFSGMTNSKNGTEYQYYSCITKKRNHECNAKNIPCKELDPLIIDMVKKSILNDDIVDLTADAIIESLAGLRTAEHIRKDINATDEKISKLLFALESGVESQSIRDRLLEHEHRKEELKEELKNNHAPIIDRSLLVQQIRADIKAMQDNTNLKQIMRRYIRKIEITDTDVIIHAVGDLHTDGSSGAEYAVCKKATR